MLLLVCRQQYGKATFPPEYIGSHHAPERSYEISDGYLFLSGYPHAILHHDADELLRIPGRLYRIATPNEQERYLQAQRSRMMIQEVCANG